MASFTDNPELLSRFNPYVQQLPVEAMVEVGMKKQAMYNEGIQKIQTNIDNIAGLDVIRGVDRKYLQSKINQLGNNIRTVAAGDFSDFQLVNSTTGMVNQVAKDKIVQNSVSASAMYRREMQRIQKDQEEGKENPNNTNYFHKKANNWFNGTKPGESLNEKYFTPIDVWGKITNIAKEVGIDSITEEEMFVTDNTGQRVIGKDGNPILNKVTLQKKMKGKDPAKLLDAFQKGLTPADYKQLSIDGIGNNAHMTPEDLKISISETSKSQIGELNNIVNELDLDKISEESKPNRSQEVIDSIQSRIDSYSKQIFELARNRDKSLEIADRDPDSVRAALHTNSYLYSMSKDLGTLDKEEHYTENVLYKQNLEDNKFAHQLEQDSFNRLMTVKNFDLNVQKALADREDKKEARKNQLTEWYLKYGYGTPPPGLAGTTRPTIVPTEGIDFNATVEDDFQATVDARNTSALELTLAYLDKTVKDNPGRNPEERREHNLKVIKASSGPGKKLSYDEYIIQTATYMQNKWNTGKESIPLDLAKEHQKYNTLTKDIQSQKTYMQEIDTKARNKMRQEGLDAPSDAEIKSKIKPAAYMIGNQKVVLNAEDQIQIAHLKPELFNTFGSWFVDKDQERKKLSADKYLNQKFGNSLPALLRAIYPIQTGGESGTTKQKPADFIKNVRDVVYSSNINRLSKIKSDMYKEKMDIPHGQAIPIQRGKENFADKNRRIKTALSNYVDDNGKIIGTTHTIDEVYDALSNEDGNIQFNVNPRIGRSLQTDVDLVVSNKTGTGFYTIPVNADVFREVQGYNPPTKAANTAIAESLRKYKSTNQTGNPKTAHWKDNDFTNFKHPGVTINADLISVKGDPSEAVLRFYIYDKKTGKKIDERDYPKPFAIKDPDGNDYDLESIPSQINATTLNQIIR